MLDRIVASGSLKPREFGKTRAGELAAHRLLYDGAACAACDTHGCGLPGAPCSGGAGSPTGILVPLRDERWHYGGLGPFGNNRFRSTAPGGGWTPMSAVRCWTARIWTRRSQRSAAIRRGSHTAVTGAKQRWPSCLVSTAAQFCRVSAPRRSNFIASSTTSHWGQRKAARRCPPKPARGRSAFNRGCSVRSCHCWNLVLVAVAEAADPDTAIGHQDGGAFDRRCFQRRCADASEFGLGSIA